MIKGYVKNNSGRGFHIFKRPVSPGMKVSLESLYLLYERQFGGSFSLEFVEWLEQNKVPEGFDIVVEKVQEVNEEVSSEDVVDEIFSPAEKNSPETPIIKKRILPGNITAKEITELRVKDNPKKIIQGVMSVPKLRRALGMLKGRPGKEMLIRIIRTRLTELS